MRLPSSESDLFEMLWICFCSGMEAGIVLNRTPTSSMTPSQVPGLHFWSLAGPQDTKIQPTDDDGDAANGPTLHSDLHIFTWRNPIYGSNHNLDLVA